jgi:hypothetical protein
MKIITFIMLIQISFCKLSQMGSLRQELFKPKKCIPSIIEIYISGKASRETIQSDQEMLSICPDLEESCCTRSNLKEMSDLANDRIQKNNELTDMFNSIIKTIRDSSDSNINNLFFDLIKFENPSTYEDAKSFDQISDYTDSHNMQRLKAGIEYIKGHDEMIIQDVKDATEYVNELSSRFGCSVCKSENVFSIKNINTKKPSIVLDMKQCQSIFSDPKYLSLFAMDMHMSKMFDILYVIATMRNGRAPNDEFITEDEFRNIPDLVKKCNEGTNFLKLKDCNSLCVEMKFFNGNAFRDITTHILASQILMDHYFKGSPAMSEQELNETYEGLLKRYKAFAFFQPHKNENNLYLETISKEYAWGSGWNVLEQEFAMKNKKLLDEIPEIDRNAIVKGVDDIQDYISNEIKNNILLDDEDDTSRGDENSVRIVLSSILLLLVALFN